MKTWRRSTAGEHTVHRCETAEGCSILSSLTADKLEAFVYDGTRNGILRKDYEDTDGECVCQYVEKTNISMSYF